MIRYALKCPNDHTFESWFKSAEVVDSLLSYDQVECPTCGSTDVAKTLMAPSVRPGRNQANLPAPAAQPPAQPMVNAPEPDVAEAIQKLRDHVEQNSDYVGSSFAKEARAMHEGEQPSRPIHGEARPEEAKKLIEDGVPALPLPFVPKQKVN